MARRIEDYALIGDLHTAALVSLDGSIDWMCLPRFDSPACFAALLGDTENGRWLIAPKGGATRTTRRYRDDTLILETTFETPTGAATLIDFMPLRKNSDQVDLVRMVRGDRGVVEFEMDFTLRFAFGSAIPWVQRADHGINAIAGPDAVQVWSPVELAGRDFHTISSFSVRARQTVPFTLAWRPSHLPPRQRIDPRHALQVTEQAWREWVGQCSLGHEWRNEALRSLITLKALTYRPTGGIVAAPTTSLPEHIGGVRNWDYRFCWLRDATMTLYALLTSGFHEEAGAWREWLLRSSAGRASQMQIMYGIGGERLLKEFEIDWLSGYENSRPVRVGNAAHQQLQLDVFGEVMDTLHTAALLGISPQEPTWEFEREMMEYLESVWDHPDHSMWEMRGSPQDFTVSKVMAWVALDRAIRGAEQFGLEGPLDRWRALRQQIHQEVCERGFDSDRNTFVQAYGQQALDAALLMIPQVGFLPPTDPRVVGTVEAIEKDLLYRGFIMRYDTGQKVDGLPSGEGAFLACTFWYADALHLLGRNDEARVVFERLLSIRNDVGLLAEEYDPDQQRQLGNFPQAFSHVALVNTAHNLGEAEGPAKKRSARGEE